MTTEFQRRELFLGCAGVIAGGVLSKLTGPTAVAASPAAKADSPSDHFRIGLNTSTIRGQNLAIVDEVAIAAKAGFQALEPWVEELERHVAGGGSLDDLGKQIKDAGISVESAIGFFDWIVDDPDRRRIGLEKARKAMELVRKIGGTRLAAPPVGATDKPMTDFAQIGERYRALLEIGDQIGVVPQAEVWGFSKTLGRLGEAACIAIEAAHPKACILPDVYHLYRGGSDFQGIKLLSPRSIHVFHVNDYPADPPRTRLTDADRVYPGDGVAPLRALLRDLAAGDFHITLSLELFNRKLWSQDPRDVAKTGFDKLHALVQSIAG